MSDCEIIGEYHSEVIVIGRKRRKLDGQDNDWKQTAKEMLDSIGLYGKSLPSHIFVKKLNKGDRYKIIDEYFENSVGFSNPYYLSPIFQSSVHRTKIINIWQVTNVKRSATFVQKGYDQVDNCLLWHGTKKNFLSNILTNGLRMPAPNSHKHSYGPAIYLADRARNSMFYTDMNVLLVCQVAVGTMFLAKERHWHEQPPEGHDTVLAVGQMVPDVKCQKTFGNCRVPAGPAVQGIKLHPDLRSALTYNEYLIYDPDRILVKYIVQYN